LAEVLPLWRARRSSHAEAIADLVAWLQVALPALELDLQRHWASALIEAFSTHEQLARDYLASITGGER
jgi:hypothetical protein